MNNFFGGNELTSTIVLGNNQVKESCVEPLSDRPTGKRKCKAEEEDWGGTPGDKVKLGEMNTRNFCCFLFEV